MSFVCSWHLSQKELRLSTPLISLRGERVHVKESARVRKKQTETKEEGTREGNRGRLREYSRRRCDTSRHSLTLIKDRTLKNRSVPCSDIGHIRSLSSPVVTQTISPLRAGYQSEMAPPALQVEQGPSHGENRLRKFPSKNRVII